ncbi:hypothetical protein OSB04_un000223 [Centaurea solstitialis]|uniref:F-box associated beta-propeller type 3 domain-containing protein n=1 Tax=Centaurea solstitialis TaxID=347529 RepID=A0AA38S6L4_9ASTR|nr:hypothetical protein OSB04_un000223 [Centaurea solstitialis]
MHQVGSVNGLICLWHYGYEVDNTYICNPVTREYMILPRQRFQKMVVVYGFGVSSLTGEYKVVRAFQRDKGIKKSRSSVLEAEVYTLGTGQWRSLPPVPVTYLINTFGQFCGPFLNNHWHWFVNDNVDAHVNKICTFDLDKETFQSFPSPPVKENRYTYRQSLAILKGCLCILDTYNSELTIWVMKNYGINNSWCKQVVNRTIQWPQFQPDDHIHLIAGLKDGSFFMVFENKVCVFHPRRKTIEDTKFFELLSSGCAYSPSFLNLRSFESERILLALLLFYMSPLENRVLPTAVPTAKSCQSLQMANRRFINYRGRLLDTCPIKAYRINLPYKANRTKTRFDHLLRNHLPKCLPAEVAAVNSAEYSIDLAPTIGIRACHLLLIRCVLVLVKSILQTSSIGYRVYSSDLDFCASSIFFRLGFLNFSKSSFITRHPILITTSILQI